MVLRYSSAHVNDIMNLRMPTGSHVTRQRGARKAMVMVYIGCSLLLRSPYAVWYSYMRESTFLGNDWHMHKFV